MSRNLRSLFLAGIVVAMSSAISTQSASAQSAGPGATNAQVRQKVATRNAPRVARAARPQPVRTPAAEKCDNLLCKFFVILGVAY